MRITKTYKYRLKLTKVQEQKISSWIGACRFVYNSALELKLHIYNTRKENIHKFGLMKQLKEVRAEYDWIKDVPSGTLQDVIERLDKTHKNFFRGAGFPKFAKKGRYNSITVKSIKQIDSNKFQIPKIGVIRIFNDRQPEGELKRATIKKELNKFYISIVVSEQAPLMIPSDSQVGVDMGLVHFATLSNNEHIPNPKHYKEYEQMLRKENRSLARKKKGSKRREKQKLKLQKLHRKIRDVRDDFLHKTSTSIIRRFGTIAVEDLRVKNMIKFGNLGKHISDAGWGKFLSQLEYKSVWYGNTFIKVNPQYTSQTCSECGEVNSKSRISQSKFVCVKCGHIANSDVQASKIILLRGLGKPIARQREIVVCA